MKRQKDRAEATDNPIPHNTECEVAVLAGIIISEKAETLYRLPMVTEDTFFHDKHRLIWRAICLLAEEGEPINILTVKTVLAKRGELDLAGGSAYISSLDLGVIPDVAGIEKYGVILEREAKKRAIITAANSAMRRAIEPSEEPEEIASELIERVGGQVTRARLQARHIAEVTAETSEKMERLASADRTIALDSPWPSLNRMMLFRPTLAITACHSKFGKTAWGIALAYGLATNGHPSLFVSLESGEEEIALRNMSATAGIPHQRVQDWRTLSDDHRAKILAYRSGLGKVPLFIVKGIRNVESVVLEIRRLQAIHGIKAVFIDYIQNLGTKARIENREERLHEISKTLLDTAVDLGIHINALSQVGRDAGKDGARYRIEDLAYATSIAKSARAVMFINRPTKMDEALNSGGPSHPDYRDKMHVDFQVVANNEGVCNDFVGQFDETTQRFWEGTCKRPCMNDRCRGTSAEEQLRF